MVNLRDGHQVLRGLGLVIDHYITQNKGPTMVRAQSAQYHARELLRLFLEQARESSAGAIKKGSSSSEKSDSSSSASANVDVIGFDSISGSDSKEYRVPLDKVMEEDNKRKQHMKAQAVPATQAERLVGFGSLFAKMAMGRAAQRVAGAFDESSAASMSDKNAEVLAEALCRMRGAALKLGQMLSVQDDGMMPPALAKALDRVKQSADYMPSSQLQKQLRDELGPDWREKFLEFDEVPIAAASIGQVHKATLLDGSEVAMKIQYPGVATSINSDLSNLKNLVTYMNIMPPGLFIDEIIRVASQELAMECDYVLEAQYQDRYRELVAADPVLSKNMRTPKVFKEFSTKQILTSEYVKGVTIDKALELPEPIRNAIARSILVLTLRELFEWRFVQSDPNFGNFLYDDSGSHRVINLIDFGASREYSEDFVSRYMKVVWAASNGDRQTVLDESIALGFLTGDEAKEMTEAHVDAAMIVGEPFKTDEPFDFGSAELTKRIGVYGAVFMKYRLKAPPTEAYSLHRKLAGAILLCIRLRAKIPCRDVLEEVYRTYNFEEQ